MSIHVMSWVFKHSDAELGERLVLLALAEFANDDGTDAYPSVKTLVERTRLSERQVQYCLRSLENSGKISADGKGPRGTNRYAVTMKGGAKSAPGGVQSTAPDPPLENLSEPYGSAQQLVSTFVDRSRARGSDPPSRVIGQIAKETKLLISEGQDPAKILAAYDVVLERGLHPSTLASCVQQVSLNGKAAPKLPPFDRAKEWVMTAGWQYPDGDLAEELGRRGIEGDQKRKLMLLARRIQKDPAPT